MEIAANPKKLQDETKLEAGLNASLELQCRETMEIRTKHARASFEASLQGLKAMEIGAKQQDKEGALFWTSKRKKKQARINGPPQYLVLRGSLSRCCFSGCLRMEILTPYGNTLWIRVKRHVIHHWLYSLYTEDTWKATARVHRVMEDWQRTLYLLRKESCM